MLFRIARSCSVVLICGSLLGPQGQPAQSQPDVDKHLARFTADDWQVRRQAFYQLIELLKWSRGNVDRGRAQATPHASVGIIRLLERENSIIKDAEPGADVAEASLDEAYLNYHGDLISIVAALEDPRALNALLGAIETGSMATRGLARLGRVAVQPIVEKLRVDDPDTRHAAATALVQMVEPETAIKGQDAPDVTELEDALRMAVRDSSPDIRIEGVRGLVRIGSPKSLSVAREIANSDPFVNSRGVYVVREAARRELARR